MKRKFSRRYQAALLTYLKQGLAVRPHTAHGMGRQALRAGLQRSTWPSSMNKSWSHKSCQAAHPASVRG